jgi:hypothetical protein
MTTRCLKCTYLNQNNELCKICITNKNNQVLAEKYGILYQDHFTTVKIKASKKL